MIAYQPTLKRAITLIALAMSLFHLYVAWAGPPNAFTLRTTHFGFALTLAFLSLPLWKGRAGKGPGPLDWALLLGAIAAAAYPIVFQQYFTTRMAYVGPVSTLDQVMAVVMIVVVLEGTRRAIGPILPITAMAFLGYQLLFTDTRILRLLEYQYMTTDALFGIPAQVSATYVVLFVIFGALAERMGIGKLFMDFALALTGHQAGGPAKVAVVTSGLFGSVSGSAVANVMTTGTFTIPLMKRIGYPAHFSGAVEAVASTGGQIMPPIMGAAAFVMAEFLGVGYLTVASFAILPALLYYLAVFLAVHFEARKQGLKGLPRADLPRVGEVLGERGHLFLPLVIIIGTLMWGFSAPFSALMGILSVVPVVLMRRTTRSEFSLAKLIEGLEAGAINSVLVALACASAGIVIGVIAQTGLGLSFTSLVRAAAQDMLLPALVLTMVAGIILGMGMPTTPAYIVQVALLVPALVRLGIPVEAAHMFVFYFAILSAITPPRRHRGLCRLRDQSLRRLADERGGGEARTHRLHHPVHVRLRPLAPADRALGEGRADGGDVDHRGHVAGGRDRRLPHGAGRRAHAAPLRRGGLHAHQAGGRDGCRGPGARGRGARAQLACGSRGTDGPGDRAGPCRGAAVRPHSAHRHERGAGHPHAEPGALRAPLGASGSHPLSSARRSHGARGHGRRASHASAARSGRRPDLPLPLEARDPSSGGAVCSGRRHQQWRPIASASLRSRARPRRCGTTPAGSRAGRNRARRSAGRARAGRARKGSRRSGPAQAQASARPPSAAAPA